jgi:hypothetical protein
MQRCSDDEINTNVGKLNVLEECERSLRGLADLISAFVLFTTQRRYELGRRNMGLGSIRRLPVSNNQTDPVRRGEYLPELGLKRPRDTRLVEEQGPITPVVFTCRAFRGRPRLSVLP